MALPVQRTYSATIAALNAPVFMVDNQTLQNNFLTLTPNVLQDVVNLIDPAATQVIQYTLVKNGNATSVRCFSPGISATTSGRVPIGPVSMSSGSYQWQATQSAGVLFNGQILVRYGSPLN
jgi:hypothetical protein